MKLLESLSLFLYEFLLLFFIRAFRSTVLIEFEVSIGEEVMLALSYLFFYFLAEARFFSSIAKVNLRMPRDTQNSNRILEDILMNDKKWMMSIVYFSKSSPLLRSIILKMGTDSSRQLSINNTIANVVATKTFLFEQLHSVNALKSCWSSF